MYKMPSQNFCVFCQKHWDTPRVKFFHIPKDAERRKVWSNVCGLELTESFKICEQHFNKRRDIAFSRTYKRYRLLKDATPSKEIVYIVPENGVLYKEHEEEYYRSSKNKRKQTTPKKSVKDAETQTRYDNQMISCGSLQVTKDYRIFTITCDFCKTTFTLWNYASYMQHIKSKHRYEEEEIRIENPQVFNSHAFLTSGDMALDYVVGDSIEVDYEEEFIEYDPSGDEQNVMTADENTAEMERLKEILAKNNVVVKKFGEEKNEEHVIEEVIDVGDSEIDNVINTEGMIISTNKEQHDLIDEITVYTTDEILVWSFIEMLKTYPLLWHPPQQKLPENYLLTMLAFCKVFNEEYQLGITNTGMRNSIENLQKWYQECYQDNKWEQLSYPYNEYFHKCATFLSDKADGSKTCEICRHEALDYLQYVLHKKNAHDIPLSESCLPNEQVEMYLRTRWYRVLNLECQLCTHKYKYINAFVIHMKAHADVREFICDLCGAAFVRLEGLNVHRRRHTGPIQRICKICNKGFNDFQLLGMHRRRYHRPIEGTIEEIEENLKTRRRNVNKRTVQSTKYTTRIDPKTNKRFYICHFCGKEYHQYSGLHKHFRLWHKSEWVPSGRVGRPKRKAQNIQRDEYEEEGEGEGEEEGEPLYADEYTEEYAMNAEEIEVENIYAEVDGEEVEGVEVEEEIDDGNVEFDFDMEPAEEIEIQ